MKPDPIHCSRQGDPQDEEQHALSELFQLLYERGCKVRRKLQTNNDFDIPHVFPIQDDGQESTIDSAH
jgi:hypothetical protein